MDEKYDEEYYRHFTRGSNHFKPDEWNSKRMSEQGHDSRYMIFEILYDQYSPAYFPDMTTNISLKFLKLKLSEF